jgi:ribosomal protein S18 acetylase RimI-like enzyme
MTSPFRPRGSLRNTYRLAKKEATVPLRIRRATPADLAVVVEFNRRLAEETEGKALDPGLVTPGTAAGLADPNRAAYFVAEEAGEVVGQVMLTREWSDWRNGWFWWLQSVYVRADARRRGVFRALYGHVLEEARRDPAVVGLRLYVETANAAARQTYLRLGLSDTGYLVLEDYFRDPAR